jgi:prepilin-type N-terminal cleavage/methylation domain-containing protein
VKSRARSIPLLERPAARRLTSRRGFSLVEIMVVVLILSVLGTLAVPSVARLQRRAKTATIVSDFRVFATAFETYSHETGRWPSEVAAGAIPAVMATRLNRTAWLRRTPMGGKYNWESNQTHFGTQIRAAIAISSATGAPLTLDVPQLQDLEQTIDKGSFNWLGGNFQLGTGLVPLYVIQR